MSSEQEFNADARRYLRGIEHRRGFDLEAMRLQCVKQLWAVQVAASRAQMTAEEARALVAESKYFTYMIMQR